MDSLDVGPEILRNLIKEEAFHDISSFCETHDEFNRMCNSAEAMSVWKSELLLRSERDVLFLMMVSEEPHGPTRNREYLNDLVPSDAPSVYKATCMRMLYTSVRESMSEYFWGQEELSDHLEQLLGHPNIQSKHLMEIIVSTFTTGFQEPKRHERFRSRLPKLLNTLVTPLADTNLLRIYNETHEAISRVDHGRCFIYQQFSSWLNRIHSEICRSHCVLPRRSCQVHSPDQ
jgi:hypothetical protein